MAFVPNVNWVNDEPPGFEADEMIRMQLGIAGAEAAAAAVDSRLGQYGQGAANLYVGVSAGEAGDAQKTIADTSWSGGYENTFLGAEAGRSTRRGWKNTSVGKAALRDNVDGYYNVAVGNSALERNLGGIGAGSKSVTDPGARNTAIGSNALRYQTTARGCVGIGRNAAHGNLTGNYVTAVGTNAYSGTIATPEDAYKTASNVTAVGYNAAFNTDAPQSTAIGVCALYQSADPASLGGTAVGHYALFNSEAKENTAVGNEAGRNVTSAYYSLAIGARALGAASEAVTGSDNLAVGTVSLPTITSGRYNVGVGRGTLDGLTTGFSNTAVGHQANLTSPADLLEATAVGAFSKALHDKSVALGARTVTTAADQVAIGARHMEISTSASAPAGSADSVRLYLLKSGSTYTLQARFPGGGTADLATGS